MSGQVPARDAARSARVRRAVLVVFASLLVNELGINLFGLVERFERAKVLHSLSADARDALLLLGGEVLLMLAVVVLGFAAVAWAWGTACALASRRLQRRRRWPRAARLALAATLGFAGFHVYYAALVHAFPATRLAHSPLAVVCGVPDPDLGPRSSADVALTLACALVVAVTFAGAALASRRYARRLLVGALALAAAVGVHERLTRPGAPAPFTADGNLVVIGLDSFQQNRLRVGGAPYDVAPHVNAFLESAHRFDNAWTPFARTYPSWLSVFTGRYPTRHGVRFNLVPDARLTDDNRYLADELGAAGYATLHATDETRFSIVRERFGFERLVHPRMGVADFLVGGFFDFSTSNWARQTPLGNALFPMIRNNRAVIGYEPGLWTRELFAALDTLPRDRPVYVNVHLCGNHHPFTTPGRYRGVGRDEVEGCIAMVDEQVGAILGYLDRSGLAARATTVLMSDHGDGWSGDPADEVNTHGDHLDRLLANKVVLGVRGPGVAPGRSDALVRTFDLYPTLLELAGVEAPADVDGLSLVPAWRGGALGVRRCFAESGFDKKTFTVARLIEEHSSWYEFDPETELVTLRDDGYAELMENKSYTLLEGELRVLLTPARGRFKMLRFDAATGTEVDVTDDVPARVRQRMLRDLVDHYGLDWAEIEGVAAQRGFLARV